MFTVASSPAASPQAASPQAAPSHPAPAPQAASGPRTTAGKAVASRSRNATEAAVSTLAYAPLDTAPAMDTDANCQNELVPCTRDTHQPLLNSFRTPSL